MKKLILIYLLLMYQFAFSADQIAEIDFENNVTDTYGNATVIDYGGSGQTFVSGYDNLALRTSHNGTDAGGSSYEDLRVIITMPASRELYISMYIRYETAYEPSCGSINNIKYAWIDYSYSTFRTHWELILQSGTGGFELYPAFDSSWGDDTTNTKYATQTVVDNSWHHVEFYVKESTGTNNFNADGTIKFTIDNIVLYNYTDIKSGRVNVIPMPSIKATCTAPLGEGWWLIDEWTAWDGLPTEDLRPTVEMTGSGTTVDVSTSVTIQGTATATSGRTITGITSPGLTVTCDDGTCDEQIEAFSAASGTLDAGLNTFIFTATDSEFDTGQDTFVITYTSTEDAGTEVGGSGSTVLGPGTVILN